MVFVDYFNICWVFVEIIFYLFHISMLVLLICKRNGAFPGAFYNMFRVIMVADLFFYGAITLGQRFPNFGFFVDYYLKNQYTIAYIVYYVLIYAGLVQYIGQVIVSFNRFMCLVFPLKYQIIWKYQWYTIVIIFLPFFHLCYRLDWPVIYTTLDNGFINFSYPNKDTVAFAYVSTSIIYFTCAFFEAIFSIAAVIKCFHLKKTSTLKLFRKDAQLLVVCCIVFFMQVLRSTFNYCMPMFAFNGAMRELLTAFFNAVVDIGAWSRSVSLIVLSPTTRDAYFSFYFNKRSTAVVSTSGIRNPSISKIVF